MTILAVILGIALCLVDGSLSGGEGYKRPVSISWRWIYSAERTSS